MLPIGQESGFSGVVDLIKKKAYYYKDASGKKVEEKEIPATMQANVDRYRERLTEAVAEADDDLMMKYLDGAGGNTVPMPAAFYTNVSKKMEKYSNHKIEEGRVMQIKRFEKISETPFYDSKWIIVLEGRHERPAGDKNWDVDIKYVAPADCTIIGLTRFDGETEEDMKILLEKCESISDIIKLHKRINYD
jgi:hypothetical protein